MSARKLLPVFFLVLCVVISFSVVALIVDDSSATIVSWTAAIDSPVANARQVQECQNVTTYVSLPVLSYCSYPVNVTSCNDPPINKSCTASTEYVVYDCQNGTTQVPKVNTVCSTVSYVINNLTIDTREYGCSIVDDGKTYLTCDSKYDGNGDGICTSGESCLKFGIVGNYVTTQERNSQDTFVDADKSFYLAVPSAEVTS